MAEERRQGLSQAKQEEMYDIVKKLDTHLLGPNGDDGILSQFKENDKELFKRMGKIERKWWYFAGAIGVVVVLSKVFLDKLF